MNAQELTRVLTEVVHTMEVVHKRELERDKLVEQLTKDVKMLNQKVTALANELGLGGIRALPARGSTVPDVRYK